MKHRKLRIAWSVAWGVVAVLLCVLWVWSYFDRTTHEIFVTPAYRCYVHSLDGTLGIERVARIFVGKELFVSYAPANRWRLRTNAGIKLHSDVSGSIYAISVSYWLAVLLSACAAVIPWRACRFSLRALLVATTLIAVALGTVMWNSRSG